MAKVRHVSPPLGSIKALNTLGLSTDFAGVLVGVAGSALIAPATPPNRGVTGMPDERSSFLVGEGQLSNHGTRADGWTPRASIMIVTRGPLIRLAAPAIP
jgi:hypothetical protein